MLSQKHVINFSHAQVEAANSNFKGFHTGCVIMYKNMIIGRGCNSCKTHPMQRKYNKKYRNFAEGSFLHAEMAALLSVPRSLDVDWSKVKVYIYRICPGKELGMGLARPCPACMAAIKDKGIKHIYYSTDDGYAYERIL